MIRLTQMSRNSHHWSSAIKGWSVILQHSTLKMEDVPILEAEIMHSQPGD